MSRTPVVVATESPATVTSTALDLSLPGIGRILKLQEAANILRISRSELYRVMDAGLLTTVGTHKNRRVLESDLVSYVQSLKVRAEVPRQSATTSAAGQNVHTDASGTECPLEQALVAAKRQAKQAKQKVRPHPVSA